MNMIAILCYRFFLNQTLLCLIIWPVNQLPWVSDVWLGHGPPSVQMIILCYMTLALTNSLRFLFILQLIFFFYFQDDDVYNVYDVVDEDAYSKIVRDRQDDDWIVDDGEI